jgi:hypothetical protein
VKPPVDPERLRSRFPALHDDDLAAYAEVTGRILADPRQGGRVLAEIASLARRAQEKEAQAAALEPDERTALAYTRALQKMQA